MISTDLLDSFDFRDTCEEVIKAFNNYTIESNGEELTVNLRYADTQEQKQLKQTTQAARQFRSQEYQYFSKIAYPGAPHGHEGGNEFDNYLGTAPGPIAAQRWAQSKIPGRSPLSVPYTGASTSGTAGDASSSGEAVDSKPAATTDTAAGASE